ncbi:tetratricopeptide repeat protein [Rheinheimera oceanensis]|uniref:tetratricopeptide repeat protein n=1 Tax=Rheinheimera oceanensis TaxID=2817449 RepID=UPI001BFE640A|nr:tetratricopeptide repeat protein [Rheinheimera oceanensis]
MNDNVISIDRFIEIASQRYRYGDFSGGIDALKSALSIEPDNGFLHSYLSFGLIKQKRIVAAQYEAEVGLKLEPNSSYAHYALGKIFHVKRDFNAAITHLKQALAIEPENVSFLELLSSVYLGKSQFAEAKVILDRALELAPDDPDILGQYGDYWYEMNEQYNAEKYYNEALSIEPQHLYSLIGKGQVLLRRGNIAEAKEHAVWALQQDPNNNLALGLLTNIKARQNPLMGIWWRLNTWLISGNKARTIMLLLAAYIFFNVSAIALADAGLELMSSTVSILWFGVVIYMWVGPSWFSKKLKEELETVVLDKSF